MNLGFVTAILSELSFEEVLKVAAEIGYDCVEVMCWPKGKAERRYAGVTHIDVANLDSDTTAEIHRLTEKYGVSISALGYYPNPLSPYEEEATTSIDHLYKIIDAAKQLNVYQANSFIGRDWKKSEADNWPRFLEVWKPIITYAEEQKVKIGIENCPMSFTADEWPGGKNLKTTPAIFRKMYADIQSDYFGLNFDPSHFIWLQMDYIKAIREFGPKLFHVHAKDVRLDHDRLDEVGIMAHPSEYHTPKLPGMGDVNWGQFFSALTDTGYNGPVCVEVEDRAYEGSIERRIDSLKQSYNYLRQYIPKS
jgi:sugar phosphate isomerase/epimerase